MKEGAVSGPLVNVIQSVLTPLDEERAGTEEPERREKQDADTGAIGACAR